MQKPTIGYQQLRQHLEPLEELRLASLKKLRPTLFLGLGVSIASIFSLFYFFWESNSFIGYVVGTMMLTVVVWLPYFYKKSMLYGIFSGLYKQNIATPLVQSMGEDFSLQPDQGLDERLVESTNLFKYFNKYTSEDLISGTVNGQKLELAELTMNHKSGTGKKEKTVNIFSGVLIHIQLRVPVPSHFFIYPTTFEDRSWVNSIPKQEQVVLGWSDFDKLFKIQSQNAELVKSLLQNGLATHLIDISKDLKQRKISSGGIGIAFSGTDVWIAVPTKAPYGLFNPSLHRPVNTPVFLEQQTAILNAAVQITSIF